MSNFMDFTSDKVNIFLLLIDKSGSMDRSTYDVREGLRLYKKSFENFPESNTVVVSVCKFDEDYHEGEFLPVSEMDTSYDAWGYTAVYYSICKAAEYLQEYVQQVAETKRIVPRVTFVVFSDGLPERDKLTNREGMAAVKKLNNAGVTTVFVAFGRAITSKFGEELGFQATIDVEDRDSLVNFLGVELSNSCKDQSQSLTPLGANFFSGSTREGTTSGNGLNKAFFSKANGASTSASQSQAGQPIEDTGWFDDI